MERSKHLSPRLSPRRAWFTVVASMFAGVIFSNCVPEVTYLDGDGTVVDGTTVDGSTADGNTADGTVVDGPLSDTGGPDASTDSIVADTIVAVCPTAPTAPATDCCGDRSCYGVCNTGVCADCITLCGVTSVCCAKTPQKLECKPLGTPCGFYARARKVVNMFRPSV